MRKSSSGRSIALAVAVCAIAVALALRVRVSAGRPSLLLITVDTLRADRLGCYGHGGGLTPHLDSIAAEGALFADATTPCPVTLPAHASLLTGLVPPHHGLRLNDPPRPLAPPAARRFRTLAEHLRGAGYATAAFVSASPLSSRWGLDAGFDQYEAPDINEPGELALAEVDGAVTAGRALGFLRSRDRSRPFFLWVHLFDPHSPYAAPGGAGAPPDSPAAYDEEVAYADAQVGRLLAALRDEEALDRTVVVATADHGEALGEHGESTHGYFLYRSTVRVPLAVRYPSRVPAGTRVETPVDLTDVMPTALRLLGLSPGSLPLDGAALLPLPGDARGEGASPVQYAETLYPWRSFRWAQCCAARAGAARVIDFGGGRREVYDVLADPTETRDLASTAGAGAGDAAATAWTVLRSKPLLDAAAPPAPSADGGLGTIAYLSPASRIEIPPDEVTAALPLPSASLVVAFERALALFSRARREEVAAVAFPMLREARDGLEAVGRLDPANPAVPFWIGRTLAHQAKMTGTGSRGVWSEAFFQFQKAGAVYRDAATVSLMMQAAEGAGQHAEMLDVARLALEQGIDGGASFYCWIALAHVRAGGVGPDGLLLPLPRAAAEAALQEATKRARGPADDRHIAEIRGLIR